MKWRWSYLNIFAAVAKIFTSRTKTTIDDEIVDVVDKVGKVKGAK